MTLSHVANSIFFLSVLGLAISCGWGTLRQQMKEEEAARDLELLSRLNEPDPRLVAEMQRLQNDLSREFSRGR
jgi:predicted protein tyrosine phosphatase